MNLQKFSKYLAVFLISLIVLAGCGGSNDGGEFKEKTASKIQLLSPKNKSIDYNYVTLEVKANVLDVKAKVGNQEYKGIKNGHSFFIYNVALKQGNNKIELLANGGKNKLSIELESQGKGYPPIGINTEKQEGFEKLNTKLIVQTKLNASKYLLDKNNDGIIDDNKTKNSFTVTYTKEGRYFPTVTVKTSDGTLYSTQQNISLNVKAKPKEVKLSSITEQINDLERFGGYIWALSNSNIYKIDENNESKIETIPLVGFNNPQGFCYDDKLNIYIADSGNNRVVKLLASSNYQPDTYISQDGSFGTQGSGKGEFKNPVDCMVDSEKDNEKIYVVDNGNNRIQVFNKAGVYMSEFDGSNSKNGKLKNPESIVASSALPIISDTGNNMIRSFGSNGNEFDFSPNGLLNAPKKITSGTGGYIIADSSNKRLVLLSNNLKNIKFEFALSQPPLVVLSFKNADDNYYVSYISKTGIDKIYTNADAKGTTPIDITKYFVEALLKKDRKAMESLASNPKIVDDIFKDIDAWIKFLKDNDIKNYNTYSNDGLIAGVEILFNNTTDRFFVNLIKYKNTWYIKTF